MNYSNLPGFFNTTKINQGSESQAADESSANLAVSGQLTIRNPVPQGRIPLLQTTLSVFSEAPEIELRTKVSSKSRKGKLTYSGADISIFLDIVSDVTPLGSRLWALVEKEFNLWAIDNGRPQRDQDSLKNKFEKLVNTKKSTDDSLCSHSLEITFDCSNSPLCTCLSLGRILYKTKLTAASCPKHVVESPFN